MLLYLTLSRIVSKCLSGPTVLHLDSRLSDQNFLVAICGESLCGANLQSIKCFRKCGKKVRNARIRPISGLHFKYVEDCVTVRFKQLTVTLALESRPAIRLISCN